VRRQTHAPAPLARQVHQLVCGAEIIDPNDRRRWLNPQAVVISDLLRELLLAAGPSGHEEPVARIWREAASEFAEVESDTLGTSFARVSAGGAATLAVIGHIDEIGVGITHIEDSGLIAFSTLGGVDPESLVAQRVVIAGHAGPVDGVIAARRNTTKGERPRLDRSDLHIDIGATSAEDAASRVAIGDAGVWRGEPLELANDRIVSRALDNRLGAYAALEAARRVAEDGQAAFDVVAVASVQEEIGLDVARAAAFHLKPDVAIVIDVTHATDVPGGDPKRSGRVELGSGVVIERSPVVNRHISELLISLAEEEEIPHAVETSAARTMTDADAVYAARGGIPTGLLSIPLRYMHSPCELAALHDLEATIELVVAFARRLSPDTSFLR
jgi:putative aminopeptidase FrvX